MKGELITNQDTLQIMTHYKFKSGHLSRHPSNTYSYFICNKSVNDYCSPSLPSHIQDFYVQVFNVVTLITLTLSHTLSRIHTHTDRQSRITFTPQSQWLQKFLLFSPPKVSFPRQTIRLDGTWCVSPEIPLFSLLPNFLPLSPPY